jgi:hypothetical protein
MSVDVSEQSILEALHKVPQERWGQVLEFLHSLEAGASRCWTIQELLALPAERREAIIEAQAALAEHDYRNDPELTAFEAFGPDDLYVDDADTPAR